jgi:PAS domain S-box-containing protein
MLIHDHFRDKFKVFEACNGKEGWEEALKIVPDVIISDIMMPDMNGFEFCKRVKNDERTSHIPLLLLTALHSKEHIKKGLSSGANDYITKNSGYLYQLPSVLENAYHRSQLAREQEALRASEQRLRNIVEHMPVLLDAFDENGIAVFWNAECERVTGYTAGEIVGNPRAMELLVPDPDYRAEILAQLQTLGHYYRDWELDVTCKNGRTRTIAWSNISRDYPIPGWWSWGIGLDVTARKRAEADLKSYSMQLEEMVRARTAELQETQEQLVRQEKLAVLGQLAGGVGHELRTPLSTISNAVYYLKMIDPDAGETTCEYLDIIETEVRNSERIIAELLDFARIDTVTTQKIHLAAILERVLKKQAPPDTIQVSPKIPKDLPPALVDPRHIEQILDNLIINAYQAMPQGGELRIEAAEQDGALQVRVIDTGSGIPQVNLQKLFEPLFTTKTRGIGLGLAICKKLVEANGGTILVESREGCGSTFIMTLPTREGQV